MKTRLAHCTACKSVKVTNLGFVSTDIEESSSVPVVCLSRKALLRALMV